MAKKRKNFYYTLIFPILFLLFPFIMFFVASLIRYFNTGIFNYTNNFIYFYAVIKKFREFIFPSVIFLNLGLTIIIFYKFINKKLHFLNWLFITLTGIIIILVGNRFLFIIANKLWSAKLFEFLFFEINLYSLVFASELCFIVCSILNYFDNKYLRKYIRC